MNKKIMSSWELSFGLYPGVVIGIRSYPAEKYVEHVLYLPFVELCLTINYD
jgi:hypothetical protein|tara:strand:- start:2250 stop:2402 length:153 start_codon:yes stop_codon:yes gene_type:complete